MNPTRCSTFATSAGAIALGLAAISLNGCARPYGLPPFSQLVAEAPGSAAAFQAPDEGTVWVVGPGRSGEERHIVFSGLVRRGEFVSVDPATQKLLVDGKPVDAAIEGGKSFYQIWFQPIPRGWTW